MLRKITYFCGNAKRGKEGYLRVLYKNVQGSGPALTFNIITIYLLPGKRVAAVSTTTTVWQL
jgi:hypothetical protein